MNWESWIADGIRDLVLLFAGGGIAWLSGVSAARRTERFEREKREIEAETRAEERTLADAKAREAATQKESRNALSVVYEIERVIAGTEKSPGAEADIPADLIGRLVSIGALIPDETARECVDRFVNLADAWRLLVEWGHDTRGLESSPVQYQARMLFRLRKVLSAAARGDALVSVEEAVELESFDVMREAALDAYWEQQAEDHAYFQSGGK